ncbi:MAG: M28 family peptidase [Bacteroidales bacterium]|nr:M28 family peptidase [Bacteroidales bacterium]
MKKIYILLFSVIVLCGCKQAVKTQETAEVLKIPSFNADSAYQYVKTQVAFGPRVPNTSGHKLCAGYLSATLKQFGATVVEQRTDLEAFDGKILHAVNIIASFNPENETRILLFAHWDTRPWSDHDPNPANHDKPVPGANDGASGVGILLEMARQLGLNKPKVGVDIIFFDAEDYGAPESFTGNSEDSWCLGTQYWAKNQHVPDYKAKYGILLDMVGAPGATFYKEQISMYYASHVVNKVWTTASKLGFGQYFVDKQGGGITDDHLYVNKVADIPSIDIIQYNPNSEHGFGDYWHTTNDTMENIDKNTLFAVGTTLLNVIYNEK